MKRVIFLTLTVLLIGSILVGCTPEQVELMQSMTPTQRTELIENYNEPGVTVANWEKIIVGTTTYDEVVALFGITGVNVGTPESNIRDGWSEYTFDGPEAYTVVDFDYNTKVVIRKWICPVGGTEKDIREEGSTDQYPQ